MAQNQSIENSNLIISSSLNLSFQVADLVAIHENKCINFNENLVQLSCDGVHESRSSNVSIDVYSISMKNCKNIYPHKLVRPLNYKVDHQQQLGEILQDISANGLRISQFVADSLKRCVAKNVKGHSSWFPCEYCYSKGTKIEINDNSRNNKKILDQITSVEQIIRQCETEPESNEQQEKLQNLLSLKNELQRSISAQRKKSNILWPSTTMHGKHRSRKSIKKIIDKIENGTVLSLDESKGILGRSVLFDLPMFNFTYDVPAEYLHSSCLGLTKKLVILTFNVGPKRPRITTRKLSSPNVFNQLMRKIKVLKEFSRRARCLDVAVFKGQEYRNLSIFFYHYPGVY